MAKVENPKSAERGFTLIEIMMVLTLIVILSAITMPSLRGFAGSTRLKSSAHAIRDMLLFARDIAITERTPYLVVFDFQQHRYWLASSDTFDATDPSTSSLASPFSTVLQAEQNELAQLSEDTQQTTTTGQTPMLSRTSTILGEPQTLSHEVTLVQLIANRNLQSGQANTGFDYIYFSPTASSEDAILYLQDKHGKTMSITVERATGRVSIRKITDQERDDLGLPTALN